MTRAFDSVASRCPRDAPLCSWGPGQTRCCTAWARAPWARRASRAGREAGACPRPREQAAGNGLGSVLDPGPRLPCSVVGRPGLLAVRGWPPPLPPQRASTVDRTLTHGPRRQDHRAVSQAPPDLPVALSWGSGGQTPCPARRLSSDGPGLHGCDATSGGQSWVQALLWSGLTRAVEDDGLSRCGPGGSEGRVSVFPACRTTGHSLGHAHWRGHAA